jgi:hypothetical protein
MIAAAFLAAYRAQAQARAALTQQEGLEGKPYVH